MSQATVRAALRRAAVLALVCVAPATLAACGGSPSKTADPGLRVLALGDSETTGDGDPTGLGWVGRYARLLESELGVRAAVAKLAADGKTSAQLLSEVRTDPKTRQELERAQAVLLGIGGADLNAGDDAFAAGSCRGEACYAPVLKAFARNLDATVAEIRRLRGSEPTAIRAITQPNALTGAEDVIPPFLAPVATRIGVYQARTANRAICAAMADHGGTCIDVLHAFNGPDGAENAYAKGLLNHEDCCYPNARGHQRMASELMATGLAPVR